MEWPSIDVLPNDDDGNGNGNYDDDHYNYFGTSQDASGAVTKDEYLANLITTLVTKEIYARAARAAVSNILVDHESTGLEEKVDRFLDQLRKADDNWNTEYRNVARAFTELMAEARPRSRTLEICRGGLEAVHELLKYRLPSDSNSDAVDSDTILPARDAYVLCNSFPKLGTNSVTGTRAPDISYRYGLLTATPESNDAYAGEKREQQQRKQEQQQQPQNTINSNQNSSTQNSSNSNSNSNSISSNATHPSNFVVYGKEACQHVSALREASQLETSAASLACHTLMNPDLVQRLSRKTFVILGCDHPLSPTKSLLRIPGVTVLGIPSSRAGLAEILEYIAYNAPDDTTFVYPKILERKDDNLLLSKGPHVAQWILGKTQSMADETEKSIRSDSELVMVPMPLPFPTINLNNKKDPTNHVSTRARESTIRWAAASDLILERVLRARSDCDRLRCSVWSYQSSTTCMVVPAATSTKSTELLENRPSHEPWLRKLSLGTFLTPTIEEKSGAVKTSAATAGDQQTTAERTSPPSKKYANHDYAIVNGILTLEGPHHMLAEHIRMWRAIVTNYPHEYQSYDSDSEDDDDDGDDDGNGHFAQKGVHVFAPHVPLLVSPKKESVLVSREHARLLDSPLRVFDAGSVASLLAAISIAGIADPIVNRPLPTALLSSFKEADDDVYDTTTPFAMFWYGSFHGGIWNCPYTLESVSGTIGYFLGKAYEYYQYYAATESGAQGDPVKASSDRPSAASADASIVVDAVPPADGELPRFVQDHLKMYAGP